MTTEHIGGFEDYRAGDVYAVNDSYLVGSHLNDISVLLADLPRRSAGRLRGHEGPLARHRGQDPGQAMDSTDIYQEGYRIGPTHLYREGVLQSQTIDFLMPQQSAAPVDLG